MTASKVVISRATWLRFVEMLKGIVADSTVGRTAVWMFAALIALLVLVNLLNVVNSYVGRDFMTSIERRNLSAFWSYALLYVGVFALSTLVAVYYRFAEERLGLLWRKWLTRRAIEHYLDDRTYFRLHQAGDVPNPDQRISEDIRALTATTLSFVLMFLNATFTVVAFSGVLWSISPRLFVVAVAYAALGSGVTVLIGRRLVPLNYDQLDKEANFRARLVHVRENAESIALLRREGRLKARLLSRLDALTDNFRLIINVNRNLGFFTTGYNYLIQIIPALLVAPHFISGEVEFGVITQAAMAFGHLLGAFSIIVTQFQSISNYTAVIARLSALRGAMDRARVPTAPSIDLCTTCAQLVYEHLTLRFPEKRSYAGQGPEPGPSGGDAAPYPGQGRIVHSRPVPGHRGPLGVRRGTHPAPRVPGHPVPARAALLAPRDPARGSAPYRAARQDAHRTDRAYLCTSWGWTRH